MADDVFCVRAYQMIREGVAGTAVRVSVGRNLYPPSVALLGHLNVLMEGLTNSDRFTHYESPADQSDQALVADLLDQYLGRPGITPAHLLFTNGSQEAISIVCAFCAQQGFSAMLPLPLYYSYEQSSSRWGMPVAGYYRGDGEVEWVGDLGNGLFQVLLLPNPVTGTLFARPHAQNRQENGHPKLTLIDCVYQLGAYDGPATLPGQTRAALTGFRLEELVLLFTVSKDLSLPGLRASVMITGNQDLMRYAKADRFERVYSVSPLLGQILAAYVSLLIMNEAIGNSWAEEKYRELHDKFMDASVPVPSQKDFASMCSHFDAMIANCRENLSLLTKGDYPLALDLMPFAGYSVFPSLRAEFESSSEFLQWSKYAGTDHGLKLNPAYIFGGTPQLWERLYPNQYCLRVNLSEKSSDILIALERLGLAAKRRGFCIA